jgi:hypothetical protein
MVGVVYLINSNISSKSPLKLGKYIDIKVNSTLFIYLLLGFFDDSFSV